MKQFHQEWSSVFVSEPCGVNTSVLLCGYFNVDGEIEQNEYAEFDAPGIWIDSE